MVCLLSCDRCKWCIYLLWQVQMMAGFYKWQVQIIYLRQVQMMCIISCGRCKWCVYFLVAGANGVYTFMWQVQMMCTFVCGRWTLCAWQRRALFTPGPRTESSVCTAKALSGTGKKATSRHKSMPVISPPAPWSLAARQARQLRLSGRAFRTRSALDTHLPHLPPVLQVSAHEHDCFSLPWYNVTLPHIRQQNNCSLSDKI